jgi:hypothetical protein
LAEADKNWNWAITENRSDVGDYVKAFSIANNDWEAGQEV